MDNSTPSQAPDINAPSPAPDQPYTQDQPQQPPVEQPGKSKSKKKLLLLLALLILVVGGAAAAYFLTRNESTTQEVTSNEAQSQPAVEPKPAPTNLWVMNYFDEKNRFVEISYDGAEVTSKKQAYEPSFSSKYTASVTKKGVEVAPSDKPQESVVVLAKKSGEEVDFFWYDDADKLIVSTQRIPNKPAKPNQYYIPDVRQSFYTVNPDGTEKKKLFDQQTTYGSAFIMGVSSERNEYYWGVSTEGGPAALLNISSLETGKLQKKLNPKTYDSGRIAIVGDDAYYISTADTIRKVNLDSYKDTLFANPLGENAGVSTTALTATCSVGGSIDSIAKVHDNPNEIVLSTATNKPHVSAIYKLNLGTKEYTSLTIFKSVRQILIQAATDDKVLFSRGDANLCNSKNEKNASTTMNVYDRASKKMTEVDMGSTGQYTNISAYFFAKPSN